MFLKHIIAVQIRRFLYLKKKRRRIPQQEMGGIETELNKFAGEYAVEAQKLKLREDYRREFLGNIAHELKTPLFSIQGYLLALLDGGKDDKKILLKYLQRASSNVERLNTLVKDLDYISKLESHRIELQKSIFDINQMIESCIGVVEMNAEDKKIEILKNVDLTENLDVYADKDKISQVIINLLDNSIKYSETNKKIEINIKVLDKKIQVSIVDLGIGIVEEQISRIFERFYRVEKSRNRNQGGTGLGLAIVKHILEVHKEKIYVQSKLGEGTKMSFSLNRKF